MGPTKSISHFLNDARASKGVNGIAKELVGYPIL